MDGRFLHKSRVSPLSVLRADMTRYSMVQTVLGNRNFRVLGGLGESALRYRASYTCHREPREASSSKFFQATIGK